MLLNSSFHSQKKILYPSAVAFSIRCIKWEGDKEAAEKKWISGQIMLRSVKLLKRKTENQRTFFSKFIQGFHIYSYKSGKILLQPKQKIWTQELKKGLNCWYYNTKKSVETNYPSTFVCMKLLLQKLKVRLWSCRSKNFTTRTSNNSMDNAYWDTSNINITKGAKQLLAWKQLENTFLLSLERKIN